jgi:hypothetical protein
MKMQDMTELNRREEIRGLVEKRFYERFKAYYDGVDINMSQLPQGSIPIVKKNKLESYAFPEFYVEVMVSNQITDEELIARVDAIDFAYAPHCERVLLTHRGPFIINPTVPDEINGPRYHIWNIWSIHTATNNYTPIVFNNKLNEICALKGANKVSRENYVKDHQGKPVDMERFASLLRSVITPDVPASLQGVPIDGSVILAANARRAELYEEIRIALETYDRVRE